MQTAPQTSLPLLSDRALILVVDGLQRLRRRRLAKHHGGEDQIPLDQYPMLTRESMMINLRKKLYAYDKLCMELSFVPHYVPSYMLLKAVSEGDFARAGTLTNLNRLADLDRPYETCYDMMAHEVSRHVFSNAVNRYRKYGGGVAGILHWIREQDARFKSENP